jgi:hypothetical protein
MDNYKEDVKSLDDKLVELQERVTTLDKKFPELKS